MSNFAQRLNLSREIQEATRQHRPRAHKQHELKMMTVAQLKAETRWQRWRKDFTTRELIIMGIATVFGIAAYAIGFVGRLFT